MQLELGLVAQRLVGAGMESIERSPGRGVAELRQRGDAVRREALHVGLPESRHEHEAVIGREPGVAFATPGADRAALAAPWIGRRRVVDRLEEPAARATVIGGVLLRAKRFAPARAELDVELRRPPALDSLELLGIEAELQHVLRTGGAGELGVDRLVRAIRQPLEKIREPMPALVAEIGLVDHVRRAGLDGRLREPRGLVGVESMLSEAANASDRASLRLEPREIGAL